MKEIRSMDFPQHGEVFYFYGQALQNNDSIQLCRVGFGLMGNNARTIICIKFYKKNI
jgi:hypothetical protein